MPQIEVTMTQNDFVMVKLTEYGRGVIDMQHEKLVEHIENLTRKSRGELEKERRVVLFPPDADGWSRMQLWQLVERFGGHMSLSNPNRSFSDIKISVRVEEGFVGS